MPSDAAVSFLQHQLQTQDLPHSGRTLFAHLMGTYGLLKEWGNPESLCLAGLFHSIYGTWHFHATALPIEQRDIVQNLIGKDAELLVYIFCVTRRPQAFLDAACSIGETDGISLVDFRADTEIIVGRDDLNRLLEIEAANLLEQGGKIRSKLARLAATQISSGAKVAIRYYLENVVEPQFAPG